MQYSIFLYFLSNELYKADKVEKASWIYYLNKALNSVELFYAINLPPHFCAEHPLGSIMGRADYGDYFFFYQGCTVGGNPKNGKIVYPKIGENVMMFSNSKIIGDCCIGNNVIISANTYVKDKDIPDYSIVYGQYPNEIIKRNQKETIEKIHNKIWRK